jgi:hypothetical protein
MGPAVVEGEEEWDKKAAQLDQLLGLVSAGWYSPGVPHDWILEWVSQLYQVSLGQVCVSAWVTGV